MELSGRAAGALLTNGGAGVKALESTGAAVIVLPRDMGEKYGSLKLGGTRAQITAAKEMLEVTLTQSLGSAAVERLQKHNENELLEQKRTETGASAALKGVAGLSDFVRQWGVGAVWARKLTRLDAMLQKYIIKHFQPVKAKPMAALRAYVAALSRCVGSGVLCKLLLATLNMSSGLRVLLYWWGVVCTCASGSVQQYLFEYEDRYPQRWRLEALYESGELDGEVVGC